MSFLIWLPKVLEDAGVPYVIDPGAETRSTRATGLVVTGVVWHHTATGIKWLDGHVAALLRYGRRDLSGPLSQVGVERDGTWNLIALGRANHNGYGRWGNDSLGLEFYNDGIGEPFTDQQITTGIAGTAAVLKHLRKGAGWTEGHKEQDPVRKIDPLLDMGVIRTLVGRAMAPAPTPPPPAPTPPVTPTSEDEAMLTLFFNTDRNTYHLVIAGKVVVNLTSAEGFVIDSGNASISAVRVPDAAWVKIAAAVRA